MNQSFKELQLDITAASPLLLSNEMHGDGSAVYQSHPYITGSAMRGAFIQKYKEDTAETEEEMTAAVADYFQEEQVRFHNCYLNRSVLLPNTASSCKDFPGFSNARNKHGVKDMLLMQYKNMHQFKREETLCPECQALLKPVEPIVEKKADSLQEAQTVSYIQSGHSAIDTQTKTIINGRLYFQSALSPGKSFKGTIFVKEEVYEKVFAPYVNETVLLRAGAKKTAGLGELGVKVSAAETDIPHELYLNESEDFDERWNQFQTVCREMGLISEEEWMGAVTLMGDAVLMGNDFSYHSDLPPEELFSQGNVPSMKLVHSSVQTKTLAGWNAKWGTALDEEFAVEKGSCYLYQGSREDENQAKKLLQQAEINGIGKRKEAGLGQVVVCHPFHMQTEVI